MTAAPAEAMRELDGPAQKSLFSRIIQLLNSEDSPGRDRFVEYNLGEGRVLRFYPASPEEPYVVTDAHPDHVARGSRTYFPYGYVEFEGFNFAGMYEVATVPPDRQIKESTELVRILSREDDVLSSELMKRAKEALEGMIRIADMTRDDEGLLRVQQSGEHKKYLQFLGEISAALKHGSSLSPDVLTFFPLKGAALAAKEALPELPPSRAVPIDSTRVPRVNGEFGVGLSLPRDDFASPVDMLLKGAHESDFRLFEIGVVTGKTSVAILTLLRALGVQPRYIEIMAPVTAQQGVENVLWVADRLGMNVRVVTFEMYYDLDRPNGNDSLRTADERLVLGNPPRIAGPIALERVDQLKAAFIEAHSLEWLV